MTQLLETIQPSDWEKGGSGFVRTRWLQQLSDLVNRPKNNRVTASTNATAVVCNGAVQSTGVGTASVIPKRYGEFTVKCRVTFNVNSAGPGFVYVYRTTGAVPVNGNAPNAGDVAVAGDAFGGPANVNGQNFIGTLSFLDTGLSETVNYKYYLAVKAPNGTTLNLINASQILVMERS